ncbi:TPA: EamA family transporter, partial [Vibrio campbellii]
MQIAFWRSLSMALPMLLWTLFSTIRSRQIKHFSIKPNKSFALAAAFYGLSSVLFPVSAMTTSIANMLFIIATAPLWAAIFSWFFLSERIHPVTLVTFIFSIFGILTVLGGIGNLRIDSLKLGDITAIATAMSMAAAFVVGRQSKTDLS